MTNITWSEIGKQNIKGKKFYLMQIQVKSQVPLGIEYQRSIFCRLVSQAQGEGRQEKMTA